MEHQFKNVKKIFGFGCMRLPMNGEQVDYEETRKMVDVFLENGFSVNGKMQWCEAVSDEEYGRLE